ncbi:MAG TPA: efflux RND transporter permease subunit [Gemmataceae bacterium]|nr:efflux RND transporter permease subunit [Gemmataceae bacterium]
MWLVNAALRHPYIVYVGMLLTLVLGVVSYQRTPTDILPSLKVPVVVVFASYRGMPAPDMEQSVTAVLERVLTRCDRLEHIESRSLLGIGIVKVYFRPEVDPDAAAAQVISLVNTAMPELPPGMLVPSVFKYDASAIPVGNLIISSASRDDKFLLDLADHEIRDELANIEGLAAAPVFGGVFRQVQIYVNPRKLEALKLSSLDIVNLVSKQSQIIPTGELRIEDQTYYVNSNSMVPTPRDFEKIPLWSDKGRKTVYLGDVADVVDGQRWRTNTVRVDGRRAVYMPLLRQAGASAVRVVDNVQAFLPELRRRGVIPEDVEVEVVFDQSQYVRDALSNLRLEALLGAGLASLVVLLFLGSLRSTWIVALSIPLSVLAAFVGLYWAGHTLNIMTLGGLALVLGRVVDDSIVDVENTMRHLRLGKPPLQAVRDSAAEISVPILIATVTTAVVFFPVTFMEGMGKHLFGPLAFSAALALFASYVVARTVSPLYCARFLRPHHQGERFPRWLFVLGAVLAAAGLAAWLTPRLAVLPLDRLEPGLRRGLVWAYRAIVAAGLGGGLLVLVGLLFRVAPVFDRLFGKFTRVYTAALGFCLRRKVVVVGLLLAALVPAAFAFRQLGQELFPEVDASEFTIHMRARGGPRVEETERITAQVEQVVRDVVAPDDLEVILSNVGVSSRWSAIYTVNNGPHAAFVRVQLRSGFAGRKTSTLQYVERVRQELEVRLPGHDFFFETGGMIRRILNAGAVAPIEVQVHGRNTEERRRVARELEAKVLSIPQVRETYLPQGMDLPQLTIEVDRVKADRLGLTHSDVIRNVIVALMSSAQLAPNFWIDVESGNPYVIGVQFPEHAVEDLATVENIPITGDRARTGGKVARVTDVADIRRGQGPVEVFRHGSSRVSQLYISVADNDLAGVAAEVERLARELQPPPGVRVEVKGEVSSMRHSFREMGFSLALAVLLVYLVMAAQFSSWLDPLIMIVAAPLGLIGVIGMLWLTGDSLNIQSLMGVLMMIGISVSNSVLLVEFANRRRQAGLDARSAVAEAASVRLRPIVMTTVATVLGLLPMAIHLHPGDEMNLPLARAVIGGLAGSTLLTLFVVPVLYVLLKPRATAHG